MKTIEQISIASTQALEIINDTVSEATNMGLHIAACVVDCNGRVKAKVVMDGASIIADVLVEKKARTALCGLSSEDFAGAVGQFDDIRQSMLQLEGITLLGGGYPLIVDGRVVGAFAVGGATVDQDIACAKAVLEKLEH